MFVKKKSNVRVEVTPAFNNYIFAVDDVLSHIKFAEGVRNAILRHVDDAERVQVVYDNESRCEFCNEPEEGSVVTADWATVDEPVGMPACCNKAQDEWLEMNR